MLTPDQVIAFQIDALEHMLDFLRKRGITTVDQLNAVKARKMLEEPLWKIIESEGGKYGGRFISQGVKALEERLGHQVNPSSGKWPEAKLIATLGTPPTGFPNWREHPEYWCQLDHVTERRQLVRLLLEHPEKVRDIVREYVRGCVVLRSEHRRLANDVEPLSDDPWARYRMAKPRIGVWSRVDKKWVVRPSSVEEKQSG